MVKGEKKVRPDSLTQIHTINLAKRTHKATFKKMAPRAIKAIKAFASKAMGTKDVRIDAALNKHLWANGVIAIPRKGR
jgi:ribosomal protein L31E